MTMCRLLACVFGMLVFGSFFFNTQSLFVEWSALFCAIGCDSSMVRQKVETHFARMQSKISGYTAFFYFRDICTPFPPERGHPCCESMDAQGKHSCNSAWASHNDVGVLEGAQH